MNNFDKTLDLVQQLLDPKTPEIGIEWEHVCSRAVSFSCRLVKTVLH